MFNVSVCSIMVKTYKVKVDKGSHIQEYDDDEYEKLICELSVSAKKGRNAKGRSAFMCIYCAKIFALTELLNYHHLEGCDRALDINGKPFQFKLKPYVTSGGAVEVRDILENNNLHVRNTFKCIHCNECLFKQWLNYHCHIGCPGVLDINGQPSQLKLLPSVPSGGAAEFRNISEKHNFHRVCEPEETDLLASFGEDVLHGNPNEMMGCRMCIMVDTTKGAKYQGEKVQMLTDLLRVANSLSETLNNPHLFGPDIAALQEQLGGKA
jgi:hypothetical protein